MIIPYIRFFKTKKMKKIIILIFLVSPILLFAQDNDDRGYIVKVGDACPDFAMDYPDGSSVSLSDLEGKVFMLQFTASWCGVCRKEMPHIEKDIWKAYKDKGIVVIGVDRGEAPDIVKAFAEKMKITYPLALDEDEAIFQKFALAKAGVTRNVLVDRQGKIVYLTRLFNDKEFSALKNKIAEQF